jgi:hypothetical protein
MDGFRCAGFEAKRKKNPSVLRTAPLEKGSRAEGYFFHLMKRLDLN